MEPCKTLNWKENIGEKSKNKRDFEKITLFEKKWVQIDMDDSSSVTGLLVGMCKLPDYYGKMTDYVIIRTIAQYVGVGEYEMVNVEKIKTIKLDKEGEEDFKQLPTEKQQEMVEWLRGGPTSSKCDEKMSIYM